MLETFDVRLPMPEVLLHLRKVFDFRRMPWGDAGALEDWSNDSIVWLIENKFPELDVEVLQTQALKVRLWLRANKSEFYKCVPVHTVDGDVIMAVNLPFFTRVNYFITRDFERAE